MSEETLVEVGDFASQAAAEVAQNVLQSHGIESWLSVPGGGAMPELGFSDGVRLKVKSSDETKAREALAQTAE